MSGKYYDCTCASTTSMMPCSVHSTPSTRRIAELESTISSLRLENESLLRTEELAKEWGLRLKELKAENERLKELTYEFEDMAHLRAENERLTKELTESQRIIREYL